MTSPTPTPPTSPTASTMSFRRFGLAYLLGAVALFLLTVGLAAAFGHAGWTAVVVGVFLGLFAGGGLGLLVAARLPTGGQGWGSARPSSSQREA